jgi:hypothetical protein
MTEGRDRLAVLLASATERAAFSAARTAPASGLQLDVRGVGPIKLPVSRAQASQLCLVGRLARYGRGDQTLIDRGVRDTWEIPKSRVKIDKRRWDQTLVPVLDRLGRDLGVSSGRKLRAEFQSMLVYGPGQFFVEHQDSEKDDAMVGSLVVALPSTFKGGALEVRHGGRTATYRGASTGHIRGVEHDRAVIDQIAVRFTDAAGVAPNIASLVMGHPIPELRMAHTRSLSSGEPLPPGGRQDGARKLAAYLAESQKAEAAAE